VKAVLVIWEDAHDEDSADHWVAASQPVQGCYVQSIGFLTNEDSERIALASTVSGDMISRRLIIPRGMVRRIVVLDLS
jgi:hypothetical protein